MYKSYTKISMILRQENFQWLKTISTHRRRRPPGKWYAKKALGSSRRGITKALSKRYRSRPLATRVARVTPCLGWLTSSAKNTRRPRRITKRHLNENQRMKNGTRCAYSPNQMLCRKYTFPFRSYTFLIAINCSHRQISGTERCQLRLRRRGRRVCSRGSNGFLETSSERLSRSS